MTAARFPRHSCLVPFCRRTSSRWPDEFLCADHWRLVDRKLKLQRARARRRHRYDEAALDRTNRLFWRRMTRQAIERATGVSA